MENRTLFAISLMMGLLLLPLGCGSPTGPQLSEFCRAQGDDGIVTFEDANLEAEVRAALSVGAQRDLTCGLVSGLRDLFASHAGITSLVGIHNLTSLTRLGLESNSFTDIGTLSGLTSLTVLSLNFNSITDISVLSGLTNLTSLELQSNSLTDIGALGGLTNLTDLSLGHNSITDIGALSGLTGLRTLRLQSNSITDIGALSGLTSLTRLFLNFNSITDISVLSGLTNLTSLELSNNLDLSNIQPLLDNTGLGNPVPMTSFSRFVGLGATSVSCTDVAALEAKGVAVASNCP